MTVPCPDALITLAERLVEASGAVIRRHFRTDIAVDRKADDSPVTAADRDAERAIRAILDRERPDDGIAGEEFGVRAADAEHVWAIDPIDGTKAFIAGRPTFGTLVALLRGGTPILGVIDQPVLGERWIGAHGHPTRLNGAPARVRGCPSLAAAVLSTTGPNLFDRDRAAGELARFNALSARAGTTVYGGDCYAYGLLASGHCDLVVEAGLNLYDFAALVPVVAGAGGVITDWPGAPLTAASAGQVIAAGDAAVHETALAMLA